MASRTLSLSVPRLLHRLGEDAEGVVGVAAEGARVLLELRLVVLLVGDQELLLRVARGKDVRDEEPPAGEDDALRRPCPPPCT